MPPRRWWRFHPEVPTTAWPRKAEWPAGAVRVSHASARRVPSTKATRRGRFASVGRCATNAPPSSTSSHSTACGESSDAWKAGLAGGVEGPAAEAVADGSGGRRSPSTSSSVRLVHPSLAAGVDVEPAAADELVAGPRTEASRPIRNHRGRNRPPRRAGCSSRPRGAAAGPDEDVHADATGRPEHAQQIAAARVAEDDEALRPDGGHGDRRRGCWH